MNTNINLLETREVLTIIKMSGTEFKAMLKQPDNDFPSPVMLGKRKRRWRDTDIQSWLVSR